MSQQAESAGSVAQPVSRKYETRGIEYIPDGERWGKPRGLFWMWSGATFNVEFFVYGALGIVAFKLSFFQALAMIAIGSLFWILTGLCSLQAPSTGTTAFVISRAPFGPYGNRLPSIFNWITQVGFEIEGIALVVLAAIALTSQAGFTANLPTKIIYIIVAVLIQATLPMIGHKAVLKVLRWITLPFVALFVVMAILTISKANIHAASPGGWGSMMGYLALVISAGGLGFTENANDYSRYLPTHSSKWRIVASVALGGAIPSLLLEGLGSAVATGVHDAGTLNGLAHAFPAWFVWPYLIFAIAQILAINSVDLYSSGVTLQSIFARISRVHCVAIDTVVCGALAAYAVFSSQFTTLLSNFLLFIIIWLAPWCGIFLVDAWLRHGRYDHNSLLDDRAGLYHGRSGVHWPGIVALGIGMVASVSWLNAYPVYVSPLSSLAGGSDFSVFMGLVCGGFCYWLIARGSVRRQLGSGAGA